MFRNIVKVAWRNLIRYKAGSLVNILHIIAASREIGMRKVLGASVMNVWTLLIRDFMQMIGIAC